MKIKYILVVVSAILLSLSARAVPARRVAFPYVQPDGSTVRLERHGDEFFSWTTLAGSSQVVALDKNGFWKASSIDPVLRKSAAERRRKANQLRRSQAPARTQTAYSLTHGERHIPVFVVNFSDLELVTPIEQFSAMLNEAGYSYNGATGSAQDYFLENSRGQFRPVFDIYGPVTLPEPLAYYGGPVKDKEGNITANDKNVPRALYDACMLLDDQVDFSRYDADHDGFMDIALLYFAGYSQAEGGSEDCIWPHQYSAQYASDSAVRKARFDGTGLGTYICAAELQGNSGDTMCSIGVVCHEFSHTLGLPDLYDTDYEENGKSPGLFCFSIMAQGCYNNNSNTPPYYNAEERMIADWMTWDDIPELPRGPVSFGSVKDNTAFFSYTETAGEYFLYECRDGQGWDMPLPQGLLVYHVDKSDLIRVDGNTPRYLWDYTNSINAYADHPCFYVVAAADPADWNYYGPDLAEWAFPGAADVQQYNPVDWEGRATDVQLNGISFADGQVNLTTLYATTRTLTGTVTAFDGTPLSDVRVTLTLPQDKRPSRPRKAGASGRNYITQTDDTGAFTLELEGFDRSSCHVTLTREGYETLGSDIQLRNGLTSVQFSLYPSNLGEEQTFRNYDENAEWYLFGDGESSSLMAAARIPADQLPALGVRMTSVTFVPFFPAKNYYIVIDAGENRVLTHPLPQLTSDQLGQLITVDISGLKVEIPAGEDIFVGLAVEEIQIDNPNYTGLPFLITFGAGNTYLALFNLEKSEWEGPELEYFCDLVISATFMPKIESGEEPEASSFAQMGFNAICDPGHGEYQQGDSFPLKMELPADALSVTWALDGEDVSGRESVQLNRGLHRITATVLQADGTVETYDLQLDVK